MNQEKLLHIAQNPGGISSQDARELEDLTRKFPYFTIPFVLLTRYYSDQNDYRFEETLHKTALRVTDRAWLYTYVHEKNAEEKNENSVVNEIVPTIEVTNTESQFHKTEDIVTEENAPDNVEDNISLTDADTADESVMVEMMGQSKTWFEPDVVEPAQEQEIEVYEEIDSFNAENKPVTEVDSKELIPELKNVSELLFEPDIEDEVPMAKVEVVKNVTSFSGASVYNIEDYYSTVSDNKGQENDFFSWLSNPSSRVEPIIEEEEKKPDNKKLEIIERFIKNKPSVSRPKSDFFNPHDAAKKSSELPDMLVTETLANVYMGQENYVGALRIYEKLLLKNPQKRPYFAALIEKIKKEHNL